VKNNGMNVVHVASEAAPYAKTGGLADVLGALPTALSRRGCVITVIIPGYAKTTETASEANPHVEVQHATIDLGSVRTEVSFRSIRRGAVEVVFVDHPLSFDRAGLYSDDGGDDYPDNAERFALFSRAAESFVKARRVPPDVVHCHDWQSGPLAYFVSREWGPSRPAVVFTVHNAAYTGVFPSSVAGHLDLDDAALKGDGPFEFWGDVSYLKAGLRSADLVTTVSPTYARQVAASDEFGRGLQGVYKWLGERFVGVVNGVDTTVWNTATDELLPARYDADDLSGKRVCKREILSRMRLPKSRLPRPLAGVIGRLDEQKGVDILIDALPEFVLRDLSVVVLGAGDRSYTEELRAAAVKWPKHVAVSLGRVDEQLAHLIEAGSDFYLMPSRFEPCGLNQLYSMLYGTVPVVRSTGGLRDTVVDVDADPARGTGFTFDEHSSEAFVSAVDRALARFAETRFWGELMRRDMSLDFSWDSLAGTYCALYARARSIASGGGVSYGG
jgi:starch synthase